MCIFFKKNYKINVVLYLLHTKSVVQLVTCLTADPGVTSLIQARSHTLVKIDNEIISMTVLLPSADLRRVVVSYKRKNVHEVLVSCFVKLPQEKSVVR